MPLQHRRVASLGSGVLLVRASVMLFGQSEPDITLPAGAFLVERAVVPTSVHADREMLLWMISPEKHDRGELSESNPYTCPEWTLGSYYRGPTRISLVDTRENKIINTINLRHGYGDEDSFDVPYRILADYYYIVPGRSRGSEGKPTLLALRDINGDGLPLETAFFEAEACMGLLTTAIGYSPKEDKLIQYQVELSRRTEEVVEGRGIVTSGETSTSTASWIDYLFSEKPAEPGHWSYKIDYTGRGGALDTYDVRYDPSREIFVGTLDELIGPSGDRE
jgi:hypothetical protein